jgi:hypothetical protein
MGDLKLPRSPQSSKEFTHLVAFVGLVGLNLTWSCTSTGESAERFLFRFCMPKAKRLKNFPS